MISEPVSLMVNVPEPPPPHRCFGTFDGSSGISLSSMNRGSANCKRAEGLWEIVSEKRTFAKQASGL